MNRYKPVGWRGESHRHKLASLGVKTKIKNQSLAYHSLYSKLRSKTDNPMEHKTLSPKERQFYNKLGQSYKSYWGERPSYAKDTTMHKFGSVDWQNAMIYNIGEKKKRKSPLSPDEEVFLKVQHEHQKKIDYAEASYSPVTISTPQKFNVNKYIEENKKPAPAEAKVTEISQIEKSIEPKVRELQKERNKENWEKYRQGLRKEVEGIKKFGSGVKKVAKPVGGALGWLARTTMEGLSWQPESEESFNNQVASHPQYYRRVIRRV